MSTKATNDQTYENDISSNELPAALLPTGALKFLFELNGGSK